MTTSISFATRLALALAAAAPLAPAQRAPDLAEPVRLTTADGKPIDSGAHVGHSGPLWADFDGDELPDLMVGTFRGHLQRYRNVGTRKAPALEEIGLLEIGGEPVKIDNW